MVLVNTLVKQSLQEDMSNDAQHVYFLQKKKAEILARKNREKAGFEPSALLKYANDGSFLERFNKMMMQQQEAQQKQQQKQNQLKQNVFKPLSSTSLSVDTVKLLSVKEPAPVYISTTPTLAKEGYVDNESHCGDAYPTGKSVLDEVFENKKRKRKDFSSAFHEGGDINTNGNSHRFSPGKIQRFSADELAKIIQVKKTSDDLPRHLDGSKSNIKNNDVECKVEKSRGVNSSSQSKSESRKEERSSRRSSSTYTSKESDIKNDKTKQYNHSFHSGKSRKENVKEKLKTDTNERKEKKEKIPYKVSTGIDVTKKEKDRRKTEKKEWTNVKVDKTKQNKETVTPLSRSNDLSLEMTKNVSLPGSTMEKSIHINENNHTTNDIVLHPTSVCNGIIENISYNETKKNNLTEKTSHELAVPNSIDFPEIERNGCSSVVISSNCSDNKHVKTNAVGLSLNATIPGSVSEPVSDIFDETMKEDDGLYNNPIFSEPETDIEPVYFVVENSDCCELALLELIPQYNFPGRICKNGSPLPIVEFADENDIIYSKYAGSYRSKKVTGQVKPVEDNS